MYKMEIFKAGSNTLVQTFTDQKLGRSYLSSTKEKLSVKEWFVGRKDPQEFTINDGAFIPYLGEEQCYWESDGIQCSNVGSFESGYCDECQADRNLVNGSFHAPYENTVTRRGYFYPMMDVEYWMYNKNGTKTFAGLIYHVTSGSVERWLNNKTTLGKQNGNGKTDIGKRKNTTRVR